MLNTNFDDKGNQRLNCNGCNIPKKTKINLGCYKYPKVNDRTCDGYYHNSEIAGEIQKIWYLKDHYGDITNKSNIISDIIFNYMYFQNLRG